jgi:hypothetical protein
MFKSQGKKYFIPVTDIYSIFFENKEDKVYVDYVALDSTKSSHCLLGSRDAQLLHGKKGSHIVGALFGPFAILGTASYQTQLLTLETIPAYLKIKINLQPK